MNTIRRRLLPHVLLTMCLPCRFVDEQQCGPFHRWWHEHTFTAMANGPTQMTDVVEFRSPFGPLWPIVDRLVLDHYLPHLLGQRNTWLKNTLEARPGVS